MNDIEKRMLDNLRRGREQYGVVAVKAEFEAEGTRSDEFLRLLEIARRADVNVALKIGGCEALTDLLASKLYGIDYVIAPMVETAYALTKFVDAKAKVYGVNGHDTQFLFNLETQTTLGNLDEMISIAKGALDGIVFGRVDFTLSRRLTRCAINQTDITNAVLQVARACAAADLELVVGGAVTQEAIQPLREIRAVRLDRFETRKIVFDGGLLDRNQAEAGIANAVAFELDWLRNKRDYYQQIASEDITRIKMLESRTQLPAVDIALSNKAA